MDGFLIIDKPYGVSSFDVLRQLNRKFSLKRRGIKFGHGGTLDPLATGVLVVALGGATRMLQFFLSDTKSYRATIGFGVQTSTDDAEGDVIRTASYRHVDLDAIREALTSFRGKIWQTPPRYSAVHVDGARAYEVMRRGGNVDIAPKLVEIYDIDVVSYRAAAGRSEKTAPHGSLPRRGHDSDPLLRLEREKGDGASAYRRRDRDQARPCASEK